MDIPSSSQIWLHCFRQYPYNCSKSVSLHDKSLQCDNGSEFRDKHLDTFLTTHAIITSYTYPHLSTKWPCGTYDPHCHKYDLVSSFPRSSPILFLGRSTTRCYPSYQHPFHNRTLPPNPLRDTPTLHFRLLYSPCLWLHMLPQSRCYFNP